MDPDSRWVVLGLGAVVEANARLASLGRLLDGRPHVGKVSRYLWTHRLADESGFEGYLEADLVGGNTLTWAWELGWDRNAWRVRSYVAIQTDAGQDILAEFPERRPTTLKGVVTELEAAVTNLLQHAEAANLTLHTDPAWRPGAPPQA